MSDLDHSFDWKGFWFVAKTATFLIMVGVILYQGAPHLQSNPESFGVQENTVPLSKTDILDRNDSRHPQAASVRLIEAPSIESTVPQTGKFIAADLVAMKVHLYQNGSKISELPILTKGRPGTPWETPAGFYSIKTKEVSHYSTIGHVYMPYSMQFYGNYFIHGLTHYENGTPVAATFSGGCIKLSTADAKAVYEFVDFGTDVFVYDKKQSVPLETITLGDARFPRISAEAFLVADLDTGDVYAERKASTEPRPISSITKLMTTLVANETISFDKKIPLERRKIGTSPDATVDTFVIGDLFYPLLMTSNESVGEAISHFYGRAGFVEWMNATSKGLRMESTSFSDATGKSISNVSVPDDLFRLLRYLADKKSFVLNITNTDKKTIESTQGIPFTILNTNDPIYKDPFSGGKVGHVGESGDAFVALLALPVQGVERRIAIIALQTKDKETEALSLASWFKESLERGALASTAACASCTTKPEYRKILP